MNSKKSNFPTSSKLNLLRHICNYVPEFLVAKLARETGAEKKARTFKPWSHVLSLLFAQLTHSIELNDVCDALRLHSGPLSSIRGATPPSRNNLSYANRERPAEMAEKLFWEVFEHLGNLSPRFVSGKAGKRFARKFKRTIHLVDSTTIPLIASCMDWAKHRRRKAAAKCHVRLDLQSFLPRFAIVDTARDNDNRRARELCAGIKAGEIVIFDKAYVDFSHLLCLEANSSLLWDTELRPGNAGTWDGSVELLASCFNSIPSEIRELRVRADAGFGYNPVLDILEARRAHYAVVARLTSELKNKLGGLRYVRCNPIWEIAELEFRPHGWSESRRFVVARRMIEETESEPTLFNLGRYLYRAWITNLPLTPAGVWHFYDGRAGMEPRIYGSLKKSVGDLWFG